MSDRLGLERKEGASTIRVYEVPLSLVFQLTSHLVAPLFSVTAVCIATMVSAHSLFSIIFLFSLVFSSFSCASCKDGLTNASVFNGVSLKECWKTYFRLELFGAKKLGGVSDSVAFSICRSEGIIRFSNC